MQEKRLVPGLTVDDTVSFHQSIASFSQEIANQSRFLGLTFGTETPEITAKDRNRNQHLSRDFWDWDFSQNLCKNGTVSLGFPNQVNKKGQASFSPEDLVFKKGDAG